MGSDDKTAARHEIAGGSVAHEFRARRRLQSAPVAWSPSSDSLAVVSDDKTAAIYEIATGKRRRSPVAARSRRTANTSLWVVARTTRPRPSTRSRRVGHARVPARRHRVVGRVLAERRIPLWARGRTRPRPSTRSRAVWSRTSSARRRVWSVRSRRTANTSPWAQKTRPRPSARSRRFGRARVQPRRRRALGRVLAGRWLSPWGRDRGHLASRAGRSRTSSSAAAG